jgi:hypothetical protein
MENEKIKNLLEKFKKLNLPDRQYVIYGSGPLGIRGIREIRDLDVVVTNALYQKLLKKYSKQEKKEKKKRFIKLGKIEIIQAHYSLIQNIKKIISTADVIGGLRFVKLQDLVKWKRLIGREKDFKDIKLIEGYLDKK